MKPFFSFVGLIKTIAFKFKAVSIVNQKHEKRRSFTGFHTLHKCLSKGNLNILIDALFLLLQPKTEHILECDD